MSESPVTKPRARLSAMRFIRSLFEPRLDKTPGRTRVVAMGFTLLFAVIVTRLFMFGLKPPDLDKVRIAGSDQVAAARPDILDRNGEVLATDIKVMSIFAEPKRLIDKDEATELLTAALPDVNASELRRKLASNKGFVWVKRAVSSKEQQEVFHLGLPGVGFLPENKRVYPNGPIAAHVLGFANLDGVGISGLEKYLDNQGLSDLTGMGFKVAATDLKPLTTSLDLRATYAVRDELAKGVEHFHAKAGAAAILDVNTGEIVAMASLPDFDPNQPADALNPNNINRLSVGVYEMGSTFKALSIAMGLEANKITLRSVLDARQSLQYGRFTIHDFKGEHRMLTVPEVFYHSSNIGAARIAMMVGVTGHQAFLRKMGQLTRLRTELPESAEPLVPKHWGELNTITIAFGQGLNVAPLQALMAVGSLMNGGQLVTPTFLKRSEADAKADAPRVVRPEVSESLRYLMRLNAEVGSARNANIPGYFIGGKTGTADKLIHGHYSKGEKVFTTFMAVLPADKPKYLFLTLMDEPQAVPGTYGYHTAAWNSGNVTGKIIERVTPLLGLPPQIQLPVMPFPLLARMGYGQANIPQHSTGGLH